MTWLSDKQEEELPYMSLSLTVLLTKSERPLQSPLSFHLSWIGQCVDKYTILFLRIGKDANQEDFLQGRTMNNLNSSEEPSIGPLMRHVKIVNWSMETKLLKSQPKIRYKHWPTNRSASTTNTNRKDTSRLSESSSSSPDPVTQVHTVAEGDTHNACCICWGGYRDFPKKLIAIHTVTKNIDLEPFEAKWHHPISFIRHGVSMSQR